MFELTVGDYTLLSLDGGLPERLQYYLDQADLAETIDLAESAGAPAFLAVKRHQAPPFLVVAQRYEPAGGGFGCGVVLIPETDRLFVGAGTRLLAYDLAVPVRLWEDYADFGFWGWDRHCDTVLMSAELEIAAWTLSGDRLWSVPVEPPWSYRVSEGRVVLDVMGRHSSFDPRSGRLA